MEIAKTYSRALSGIDSVQVTVEIHLSGGLPKFFIVGLPETAVKESRERVRSAILTNRFEFPMKRITVNLAPADLPKEGGRYDLAMRDREPRGLRARLPGEPLQRLEFIGELPYRRTEIGRRRTAQRLLLNRPERALIRSKMPAEAGLINSLTVIAPARHCWRCPTSMARTLPRFEHRVTCRRISGIRWLTSSIMQAPEICARAHNLLMVATGREAMLPGPAGALPQSGSRPWPGISGPSRPGIG